MSLSSVVLACTSVQVCLPGPSSVVLACASVQVCLPGAQFEQAMAEGTELLRQITGRSAEFEEPHDNAEMEREIARETLENIKLFINPLEVS